MKKINYKQSIQKLTGWTTEQYNKQYDIYRLKVRTFERETGKTEKINVAASFYYTIRDQKTGKALSPQKRGILSTPALSTAKKRKPSLTASERRAKAYYEFRLRGLFTVNDKLRNYFYDESIPWATRQERIKKYLDSLNGTKKAQINKAAKVMETGTIDDVKGTFEEHGDGSYELSFEF